jgi:Ca-activated chloride channel homolog
MRRVLLHVCGVAILAMSANAQSVRSLVHGGNSHYNEEKFADAEINYRKALEKEQGLVQGHFNLGNALYKQGKFDESAKEFDFAASKADASETKAYAHYNKGNSFLKAGQYQEAVNSYINALKLNPRDEDAKYNLSYALEKLRQQQQQDNKDQNQDKNKDQNQEKKEGKDQEKNDQQQQNQDQQQQQNQQEQQKQQQQQMAQQEQRMSKEDAERILEVLKNSEKDVQKKLRSQKATRAKTEKDW